EVAAAGHCGHEIDFPEQTCFRERLKHAEVECRAANAAARKPETDCVLRQSRWRCGVGGQRARDAASPLLNQRRFRSLELPRIRNAINVAHVSRRGAASSLTVSE